MPLAPKRVVATPRNTKSTPSSRKAAKSNVKDVKPIIVVSDDEVDSGICDVKPGIKAKSVARATTPKARTPARKMVKAEEELIADTGHLVKEEVTGDQCDPCAGSTAHVNL